MQHSPAEPTYSTSLPAIEDRSLCPFPANKLSLVFISEYSSHVTPPQSIESSKINLPKMLLFLHFTFGTGYQLPPHLYSDTLHLQSLHLQQLHFPIFDLGINYSFIYNSHSTHSSHPGKSQLLQHSAFVRIQEQSIPSLI